MNNELSITLNENIVVNREKLVAKLKSHIKRHGQMP